MVYRSSRGPGSHGQFSDRGAPCRPQNVFRNDGSFLEMFKKMQEATGSKTAGPRPQVEAKAGPSSPPPEAPKGPQNAPKEPQKGPEAESQTSKAPPRAPFVGKRRGGRVLPTGLVKRPKTESDAPEEAPKDAWSAYLAEVKRYKETTCEEDGKTRPLVK